MSESSVIVRDDARLSVSFTDEAERIKSEALECGALVGQVSNAEEQAAAVRAQTELQKVISLAEKARKSVKAPVIEYGRKIDATAETFVEELKAELLRISKLVADFQQLEQAKARAAEQKRQLEAQRIERERQAELRRIAEEQAAEQQRLLNEANEAKRLAAEARTKKEREEAKRLQSELERQQQLAAAKSHEEFDAVQEQFNNAAAELKTPVYEPVRAKGQVVTTDWDIVITDIHKLYRAHANCVELKPRLSEIKSLLKMGVAVQGITATPIAKASVRVGAQPLAIDV